MATSKQVNNKAPVSAKLPQDLEDYLRLMAQKGYRSLTREIVMRLEQTRALDEERRAQQ